jgi:hypothetical protein
VLFIFLLIATTLVCRRVVLDMRADLRAEAVLRAHLSEPELAQLNRCGYLEVHSPTHSGRVYQVDPHDTRVTVLQHGEMVQRLCIRTAEQLPAREAVLAHKLMIQTLEDEYVRCANVVWFHSGANVRSR